MKGIRLLLLLGGVVSGILLEYTAGVSFHASAACWAIAVLAFVLLRLGKGKDLTGIMRRRRREWMWIFPLAVGLGIASASVMRPLKAWKDADVTAFVVRSDSLAPRIVEIERITSAAYGDFIEGDWTDVPAGLGCGKPVKVRIRTGVTTLRTGDIISVPGYAFRGKYIPKERILKIGVAPLTLSRRAGQLREGFCRFIESTPLATSTSSFLCALLAGDGRSLPKEMREEFSSAGLAHILALSGMHLAILSSLALGLLWPWKLWGGWRWRYAVVVTVLWGFALLSGMSASTVRAAIMLTAACAAILAERHRSAAEGWALAALLILIVDPGALFEAGFQLSFLCVGALIVFAEPLNPVPRFPRKRLHAMMSWLLVPMIATAATWAVSAYWFGKVPLGFMPLNLVAVPLLPYYVGVALAYLFLWKVGIEASWLRWLIDQGLDLLRKAAVELDGGGATVIDYTPSIWIVVLWLSVLAASAWFLSQRSIRA